MDTVEVVYYTCLNNDCPKHRNVFMEGDSQHERCARERLWLQGQRPPRRWLWFALPAAGVALALGAIVVRRMLQRSRFKPPMLREETEMKTWSGATAHRDDREGHAVPPPIV